MNSLRVRRITGTSIREVGADPVRDAKAGLDFPFPSEYFSEMVYDIEK